MKKIGLVIKETSANRIKSSLKDSNSLFIVKYSGVKSPDMSNLRLGLRGANATLFVVKNTVARRALHDAGLEALIKNIDGPCGLVFVRDEPVSASKAIFAFIKDHEQLKLEGGFLQDKILERKDIEAISLLPSRDVLRAQVVMTLNSPILKLVIVLNQTLKKFVYCLDQIKQKK